MVAKGHHFPGVAVAAVVDADTGLAFPDFRAEERTFQLVTQLAGRSGRDAPGKVLVQTFQPDATPLAFAARHDVAGFLAHELARREELGVSAVPAPRVDRRLRPRAARRRARRCSSFARRSGRRACSSSGLRRCFGCAAVTAPSSSRRRPRRAPSPAARQRWLAAAAPAMRRDALAAVVDVDPQSL